MCFNSKDPNSPPPLWLVCVCVCTFLTLSSLPLDSGCMVTANHTALYANSSLFTVAKHTPHSVCVCRTKIGRRFAKSLPLRFKRVFEFPTQELFELFF